MCGVEGGEGRGLGGGREVMYMYDKEADREGWCNFLFSWF